MIKTFYLSLLFFLIFLTCQSNNKMCHLSGILENTNEELFLYLEDGESGKLIDSILVKDGNFQLDFELNQPQYFLLHNKRNQYDFRDKLYLWLEPSDISIKGNYEYLKNLKVEGSSSNTEQLEYIKLTGKDSKQIEEYRIQLMYIDNQIEKEKLNETLDSLKSNLNKKIITFLCDHKSIVTLSTLFKECFWGGMHLNKEEILFVYNQLSNEYKNSIKGQQIINYLKLPRVPKIGEQALEIEQTNPNGDTIRLSDYRGKYVLVDFWASWCSPCRGSNNELVKIYTKYNSKGFEILGVAGDEVKKNWIYAIERDSLPWENITDGKGWHNEAFLLYDIKGVPSNMLVNPDGIIIGKNYCNFRFLEDELNKFLNKNGL